MTKSHYRNMCWVICLAYQGVDLLRHKRHTVHTLGMDCLLMAGALPSELE